MIGIVEPTGRTSLESIVLVVFSSGPNALAVRQEPSVVEASCFNPVTGELSEAGPVRTDATGSWTAIPPPGTKTDWVLVLKR